MSLMRRRGTAAEAPSDPVTAHEEGAGYRSQPEERQAPGYRRPATGGEGPPRRSAGAATAGSLRSGAIVLASLVMGVATLIAVLIAMAIVLRDVDANAANTIVKGVHEGANFFAGAFTGLVTFNGHPKRAITVDWGIAVLVYLIVGSLIASYLARIGRSGLRYESRHGLRARRGEPV